MTEVFKFEEVQDVNGTHYKVLGIDEVSKEPEVFGWIEFDYDTKKWGFNTNDEFNFYSDDLYQIAHKLELLNHPEDMEFIAG